jgi:hypothetical protein
MKQFTFFNILTVSVLSFAACKNSTDTKTTSVTTQNGETTTTVTTTAPAHTDPPAPSNQMCFLSAENRDTTSVTLIIDGDKIKGEMNWLPYEKDGAIGTLEGTKNAAGEFELMYNYVIEGSSQSETKVMKIENGDLMIKVGLLVDPKNDGHLRYKDVSKAKYKETLKRISCK